MKNQAHRAGRFLCTRLLAGLWVAMATASTTLAQTGAQPPATAPLVMSEERKVVRQFDTNDDRRLNLAERKAARAWLANQPPTGLAARFATAPGGVAGIRAGRGYAPTSAGRKVGPSDVRSGGKAPCTTPAPCARSSWSSRAPIGRRSSRRSTAPTSRCLPQSRSMARVPRCRRALSRGFVLSVRARRFETLDESFG